ncbi:helix-turn-helix domain-containing protein [Microvirga aerophila]|nr:helix-turn-helix domain-containing protein [Microvirga aerophila]
MIVHRALKYRLYGTEEQEALFRDFAGVCRLFYNLALEQRRGGRGTSFLILLL